MILSAWVRVSVGGLPLGLFQVRWVCSVVSRVVNCWWGRPVVGWWGNGLSCVALRIFVVIYPQGCLLAGALCSWWWGLLNNPHSVSYVQAFVDGMT